MNQTNNYSGPVMFGTRELTRDEHQYFCLKNNNTVLRNSSQLNFTSNFWVSIYTTGCYYFKNEKDWADEGTEIGEDSNSEYTRCYSNHLTEFGAGWIKLPPAIDFNFVFANSSFVRNLTIYLACIIIMCGYVSGLVWTRYMDIRDKSKMGIAIIPAPIVASSESYNYKITVFTGTRKGADTDSNVLNI